MMDSEEFLDRLEETGKAFEARNEEDDHEDRFVSGNFAALKEARIFSALVPSELGRVFAPEESIGLRRPRGTFHPAFQAILTLACPLIVSVYVGIAEAAAETARKAARGRPKDAALPYLLGEMENSLVTAQLALDSMVELANDWDFKPSPESASSVAIRKTLAVNAALAAGEKALEAMGGSGYYRSARIERMVRDLHAGQFHPLTEKRQQLLTGRLSLGMEGIEPETYAEAPVQATAGPR